MKNTVWHAVQTGTGVGLCIFSGEEGDTEPIICQMRRRRERDRNARIIEMAPYMAYVMEQCANGELGADAIDWLARKGKQVSHYIETGGVQDF